MRKVEVTQTINASPGKIIKAFVDPEMLRGWWSVERALIDTSPGGAYVLAWNIGDQGFGYVTSGVVTTYEPDALLVVGNYVYGNPGKPFLGPMTLTVRATAKGAQSEICLCQDGYLEGGEWDWYYNIVKEAWPVVVNNLKAYVEDRSSGNGKI